MKTNSTGIILLAAGASTRMGEPKQLLPFRGESLLRQMTKTALGVSDKVVVALGANREIVRKEIEDLPVQIAENKSWKQGMGGSIKIGLQKLLDEKDAVEAVILMVCDQPFVDGDLIERMFERFQTTDSLIVACEYENTLGVPALFSAKLFPELLALDAPAGAKQLIKNYCSQTAVVPFPEGAFDVDTPNDYEKLTEKIK